MSRERELIVGAGVKTAFWIATRALFASPRAKVLVLALSRTH